MTRSTATFGRENSGSGGNEDLNVSTLGPINEVRGNEPRSTAAPAVSSGTERGRQERKDRSDRSLSSKPSSNKVVTKVVTKSPASVRSRDMKSKSPRSSKDPRVNRLEGNTIGTPKWQLIAESGSGPRTGPLPIGDDTPRRTEPNDAEVSDVDAVEKTT